MERYLNDTEFRSMYDEKLEKRRNKKKEKNMRRENRRGNPI